MLTRILTVAALAAGGAVLAQRWMRPREAGAPSVVKESIDVDLPVRTVYNQWTQFEDFPEFMESVHEVRQIDSKLLHWKADVFGEPLEWDAEITEQIPDQRIAWRSISGAPNHGTVSFSATGAKRTRVTLALSYTPQNALEKIGDLLGAMRKEARGNLQRFKENLEQRGTETGPWRGNIGQHGQVRQ